MLGSQKKLNHKKWLVENNKPEDSQQGRMGGGGVGVIFEVTRSHQVGISDPLKKGPDPSGILHRRKLGSGHKKRL